MLFTRAYKEIWIKEVVLKKLTYGERVCNFRSSQYASVKQLSEATGISVEKIKEIENGSTPSIEESTKIGQALGIMRKE